MAESTCLSCMIGNITCFLGITHYNILIHRVTSSSIIASVIYVMGWIHGLCRSSGPYIRFMALTVRHSSMIGIYASDCLQKAATPSWFRCNSLKCPRLDCPPACQFPIRIITTPYMFIPWPLWPMLKHWNPENLARGHLSLSQRRSLWFYRRDVTNFIANSWIMIKCIWNVTWWRAIAWNVAVNKATL